MKSQLNPRNTSVITSSASKVKNFTVHSDDLSRSFVYKLGKSKGIKRHKRLIIAALLSKSCDGRTGTYTTKCGFDLLYAQYMSYCESVSLVPVKRYRFPELAKSIEGVTYTQRRKQTTRFEISELAMAKECKSAYNHALKLSTDRYESKKLENLKKQVKAYVKPPSNAELDQKLKTTAKEIKAVKEKIDDQRQSEIAAQKQAATDDRTVSQRIMNKLKSERPKAKRNRKPFLSPTCRDQLFKGTAKPDLVKYARRVYKYYGWAWKFFQYDHEGRFQITGKDASHHYDLEHQSQLMKAQAANELRDNRATSMTIEADLMRVLSLRCSALTV